MATEFQMPKLGLTMEAGTILQWLVDDGTTIADGDPILVIETDKVESEVNASGQGVLHQVGVVGESYDCGELIGWFLEPGEEPPAAPSPAPAAAPAPAAPAGAGSAAPGAGSAAMAAAPAAAAPAVANTGEGGRLLVSPNARRVAAELGVDVRLIIGTGPGGRIVSEDVEAAHAAGTATLGAAPGVAVAPVALVRPAGSGAALASFAARKLADELGVDLDTVPSLTGGPRLDRDDVVAHARNLIALATTGGITAPGSAAGASVSSAPVAASAPAPAPAAPVFAPLLQEPTTVVPMRGMRGTIASRMSESLDQMAQLTLFMDADMSAVVADRDRRKQRAAKGDDVAVPGFTDYVIAAAARALGEHPFANSQITADGVCHLPDIHVGMAVALDDGLMVPVIKDTAGRDLASLSAETTRLATAVREGKLQLSELEGGTFSVTALGMFDVDGFTPIINAPNSAILGVGRLRNDVAWDGERPRRTTVLTLSLTWDHRAFDGAPAAEFTRSIKRHLEACDFT